MEYDIIYSDISDEYDLILIGVIMKKIFEKHETLFCMLLIFIYVAVNSVCVQNFGNTSYVSFIANTILSLLLIVIMLSLKRTSYYGLKRVENARQYLYFLPL